MKKFMILLVVAGLFLQSHAQKLETKDVPVNVAAAFTKSNPAVKNAEWSKVGNNYQAAFATDKQPASVTFDPLGMLVESRVEIAVSALPAPVMEYVKKTYKDEEVKKAYKVTDPNETVTYEATVKGKNLSFDAKGNLN